MVSPSTVDRGWAWAVLAGVHVSFILTYGFLSSLGIFYVQWKEHFQTDATTTSWLVSLPLLVSSPLSFFAGMLASRFGARLVAMTGAAVCAAANVLGSFTSDIGQLYACTTAIGVGTIMVILPGTLIVSTYFKRWYAVANGIAIVGITVGQIIFPVLIRLLTETYGWRGAMFIIGALQMNGVAACALYRPLKPNSNAILTEVERTATGQAEQEEHAENAMSKKEKSGFLKLLTNTPVMLNILACAFFTTSSFVNIAHLPARCKEGGGTDDEGASLLLVFAVLSGATRLAHGWFVDRGLIGAYNLQLLFVLTASLSTFLNPVSDSYAFLVANVAVTGACVGIYVPLVLVNIKPLVSRSEASAAFCLFWATLNLSNGTGAVIAGKIFDATGNYTAPFLCAGAIFLMSFVTVGIVKLMLRRRRTKDNHHDAIVMHYHKAPDEG